MTSESNANRKWLQRAYQLFELGRIEDARIAAFEALAIDPESVPAYLILARVEIKCDDFAAARMTAERLLAIEPGHYYGLVYLAIGSFGDASFQPPRQVRWYQLETKPPRFAYAESLLKKAISSYPECPDAWMSLGRIQFAMGYLKEAVHSVDQAQAFGGSEARSLLLKSKILRGLRKHAEADEALRLSLSLSPDDGRAHMEAAYAAFTRNDLAVATEHAAEAVRLNPNNPGHREQFFRSLQIQSPVTRLLLRFELLMLAIQEWRWTRKLAWLFIVPASGMFAMHAVGFRDDRDVTVLPLLLAAFPFIPYGPAECARLIQILHQKTVIEHRRSVIFDLACRALLPFVILGVAVTFLYTKHVGILVVSCFSMMFIAGLLDFLNSRRLE